MNNLFISYDLIAPGRHYPAVHAAIKQLGSWAQPLESVFFVSSSYSAEQVRDHVRASMDANDKILVIDCKNNLAAWTNLPKEVAVAIGAAWSQ